MSITMCGCRRAVMGVSSKFEKDMLYIIKFYQNTSNGCIFLKQHELPVYLVPLQVFQSVSVVEQVVHKNLINIVHPFNQADINSDDLDKIDHIYRCQSLLLPFLKYVLKMINDRLCHHDHQRKHPKCTIIPDRKVL